MDLAPRIEGLIGPIVGDLGFDIVRIQLSNNGDEQLQVMVEPAGGGNVTVDDCATISRAISAILDVEDPIEAAYDLEVSSPGLDRPLVRISDYQRFAGFEAKVETGAPLDGRKRFRGRLGGVDGENVLLSAENEEWVIPFAKIRRAKLMLTDDLIAAPEI
jgi:ribosome maturation factor RimP